MAPPWGPQGSGRVAQRAHPWMRKRATQVATTQMGRMGAEDPAGISGPTPSLVAAVLDLPRVVERVPGDTAGDIAGRPAAVGDALGATS